ncbi:MAG: NfeD family protein [Hyphomicrobiaceae bacterium]
MENVVELFQQLGGWSWFALAIALIILEFVVPGVHFLWFGVSAAIVGIVSMLLGDLVPWQLQLLAFVIMSISSVFMFRRYADPSNSKSDLPDLNARGSQYVGRSVTVAEAIKGGRGKVHVSDTLWHAKGPDSAVGTKVKVVAVDGTVLVVEAD